VVYQNPQKKEYGDYRVIGVEKIEAEVTADEKPFRRKKIFNFMIRYLCPVFAAIILVSSVANALGWISM
jgi:NSS family neurotransmitter:Na+ symporter